MPTKKNPKLKKAHEAETKKLRKRSGKSEPITINEALGSRPFGCAYISLPTEVKDFIVLCHEKYGILGFSWDNREPSQLGIVINPPTEAVTKKK